jgi:hypothetical protein
MLHQRDVECRSKNTPQQNVASSFAALIIAPKHIGQSTAPFDNLETMTDDLNIVTVGPNDEGRIVIGMHDFSR